MDRGAHGRKDRYIKEKRHDVYQERGKWPEPTVCTECAAVFAGGRWCWRERPEGSQETVCPACRRAAERMPAGHVHLKGDFFREHREELLSLARHVEEQEKAQHPLERLIEIKEANSHALITTTGIHVARRIGEAVSRAYKGELDVQYPDGDKSVRITWER
ncbi:MAG: ATPase [Lentisphaerae bacterium]|nr:ATPase [Lentisphaerota bacterium]